MTIRQASIAAIMLISSFAFVPLAVAQDQPELNERVERQLGIDLPLPDRPVLANGRLIWADIALADLCAEFDGTFSKIAGKALYLCRHDSFANQMAENDS